jgi:NADPH2 dehydrogenase
VKDVRRFQEHLHSIGVTIPCDGELLAGPESPLRWPLPRDGIEIGNRFAIQPMEGWDGLPDGNQSENTLRRWRRFGSSGAKLIWGGQAVAVSHEARANPNQLVIKLVRPEGRARAEQETEEEKSIRDQIGDQLKQRIQ